MAPAAVVATVERDQDDGQQDDEAGEDERGDLHHREEVVEEVGLRHGGLPGEAGTVAGWLFRGGPVGAHGDAAGLRDGSIDGQVDPWTSALAMMLVAPRAVTCSIRYGNCRLDGWQLEP